MIIKKKIKNGFTLIELMITVAIVGILSSIALPSYQDYTVRAQVSEALNLTSGAKVFVVGYFTERGRFPNNNEEAGFPGGSGSYMLSMSVEENGVIQATFGNAANRNLSGETLSLEPEESSSGNLLWKCKSSMQGTDKVRFLPSVCRE